MTEKEGWGIWEGKEVEGRFVGLDTLFMYALPEKFSDQLAVNLFYDYSHVFFCSNWIDKHGALYIKEALEWSEIVTVEVNPKQLGELPRYVRWNCHILLAIPNIALELLKPGDDIRLDGGLFWTRFITYGSMMATHPSDYKDDRLIYKAPGGMQR